jgi:hypothetical protein
MHDASGCEFKVGRLDRETLRRGVRANAGEHRESGSRGNCRERLQLGDERPCVRGRSALDNHSLWSHASHGTGSSCPTGGRTRRGTRVGS